MVTVPADALAAASVPTVLVLCGREKDVTDSSSDSNKRAVQNIAQWSNSYLYSTHDSRGAFLLRPDERADKKWALSSAMRSARRAQLRYQSRVRSL